ncbi:MAG: CBS domain-containing protein [Clostridiales bacterium]|jgi:CBS domain-containing protein|nr:CBS domain-containing protein [Clostridiales bacterium]
MNIAYLLVPKQNVAYLYDDFTLRQALEKMRSHGYAAIPVINRDNQYVGTVSEGDFLWYLVDDRLDKTRKINLKDLEKVCVSEILDKDGNPPSRITSTVGDLVNHALTQNFIPVIDDRDIFIGIVTRADIIRSFCVNKNSEAGAVLKRA